MAALRSESIAFALRDSSLAVIGRILKVDSNNGIEGSAGTVTDKGTGGMGPHTDEEKTLKRLAALSGRARRRSQCNPAVPGMSLESPLRTAMKHRAPIDHPPISFRIGSHNENRRQESARGAARSLAYVEGTVQAQLSFATEAAKSIPLGFRRKQEDAVANGNRPKEALKPRKVRSRQDLGQLRSATRKLELQAWLVKDQRADPEHRSRLRRRKGAVGALLVHHGPAKKNLGCLCSAACADQNMLFTVIHTKPTCHVVATHQSCAVSRDCRLTKFLMCAVVLMLLVEITTLE